MSDRTDLLKRLRSATEYCSFIHPSELDGLERELAALREPPTERHYEEQPDGTITPVEPPADVAGLVERLHELAGYKYQHHTVHVPAALTQAAAALTALWGIRCSDVQIIDAQAARIAELVAQLERK